MSQSSETPPVRRTSFSVDYRIIILVLLAVIAAMLVAWRPWSAAAGANERTISVTGEAKVTAEPDEFAFNPSYSFKNADKDIALAELSKKSDEVVTKLKELGVPENKIKIDSSGYDYPVHKETDSPDITYDLRLTVTVGDREVAQKVQDYLLTTSPAGSVSPQPTFSDGKRKELQDKARDEATRDARAKADQSARNLGFTVGKVKSVADSNGFGGVQPFRGEVALDSRVESLPPQLQIQPGENDLNYSVTVTYFVR